MTAAELPEQVALAAEGAERFRPLVQTDEDVLFVVGRDRSTVYCSPSIERILGYTPDEFGRLRWTLVHPDDLSSTEAFSAESHRHPGAIAFSEGRLRHQDGSWRWFEVRAINLDDEPSVQGLVVNLRDITARKEAELALRQSEARFRALVENASDVVQIMAPDSRIKWVSPAITSVLGHDPAALIGTVGNRICHPDDIPVIGRMVQRLLDDPSVRTVRVEHRVKHADGSWRWVDSVVTDHRTAAGVDGIVATYRDITDRKEAEQALVESEARFRSVAAGSPIGIFEMDVDGTLQFVNDRWVEILAMEPGQAIGHSWRSLVHPDDMVAAAERWASTGALGRPFRSMMRVQRIDNEMRWCMVATEPIVNDDGVLTGFVGTIDDITDRMASQRDTERLSDIVEATSDLVVIADHRFQASYLNAAARNFFRLGLDDPLREFDFAEHHPRWVQHRFVAETLPALESKGTWSGELAYLRDGQEVPVSALFQAHYDADGGIEFISTVVRDISERKHYEERLEYQATHDPLTGLPNRTLFLDRLELALARSNRTGTQTAVLFCDLDHFKVINDSLGHGAGDTLLVTLANRLRDALRPGDTVARFGGDEFVILCDELTSDLDAVMIAERVHAAAVEPITIAATEVVPSVSMGIAYAQPGTDPETMIRDADAAMYLAKERGRARFEVFDERMRLRLVERLDTESALRRAIARKELRVVYQPTITLATGAIMGVEALLRWEHPERGLLEPADFIDVAEETGLIVPVGAWVIDQACRQAQRWQASDSHPGRRLFVSVNLSSRQLENAALIDNIADVISRTGIDPNLLGLEITESVVMRDPDASTHTLNALKELGVRLAVDDFGTGYSSLAYLRRFPVDLLKVDRAFVDGLGRDPEDSAIVAAVVSLAHTLGMQAIAEGVESEEQLAELRSLNCDMAQGYVVSKPLPAHELDQLLILEATTADERRASHGSR